MSDLRARLADALRKELSWVALERINPVRLADVLLSLDGIAIVELPAADSTRYEGDDVPSTDRLAWFPDGEFSVSRWNYPEVQIEYRGEPLEPVAIRTARALAAALLAAADAAEGGSE